MRQENLKPNEIVTEVTQNDLKLLKAVKDLLWWQDATDYLDSVTDSFNVCMRSEFFDDHESRKVLVSSNEYLTDFFKAITGCEPRNLKSA